MVEMFIIAEVLRNWALDWAAEGKVWAVLHT